MLSRTAGIPGHGVAHDTEFAPEPCRPLDVGHQDDGRLGRPARGTGARCRTGCPHGRS
ncbi:hypothetical protein HBB16_17965 [Pseudonocardia sp. MCCB 268]|nr:hypothetical protein [Pseudonocardia cytotoxica]